MALRIGVLARANQRGLHSQTLEYARNLNADVLVVDIPNRSSRRYPTRSEAFPGAPVVHVGAGWTLPEHEVRRWLADVDALYSAETVYDAALFRWALEAGVAVVVALNPEFVPPPEERDRQRGWGIFAEGEPGPAEWWSHTSWRNAHLPQPCRIIPMPVAVDRFTAVEPHDGPCRWLWPGGKTALADRHGFDVLAAALPLLREPCSITLASQDPLPGLSAPPHVTVRTVGPQPDYWGVYEGHDALVLPRRYGGLSLPVGEAMAAGMAVLMPDLEPNTASWPVTTVPVASFASVRMPAGMVPVADIDPRELAAAMDALADPEVRSSWQRKSRSWAAAHSWQQWAPVYVELLANLRSTSPAR